MAKPNHKGWNKFSHKNSDRSPGKLWTSKELSLLKELASKNKPTDVIATELGRSRKSVYSKASKQGIPLQTLNKKSI